MCHSLRVLPPGSAISATIRYSIFYRSFALARLCRTQRERTGVVTPAGVKDAPNWPRAA
jgi:hypothetical protein